MAQKESVGQTLRCTLPDTQLLVADIATECVQFANIKADQQEISKKKEQEVLFLL